MFIYGSFKYYDSYRRCLLNEDLRLVIVERPLLVNPDKIQPTLFQICKDYNDTEWSVLQTLSKSFHSVDEAIEYCNKTFVEENIKLQLEDLSFCSLKESLQKNIQNARIVVDGVYFGSLFTKQNKVLVSDLNYISRIVLKLFQI